MVGSDRKGQLGWKEHDEGTQVFFESCKWISLDENELQVVNLTK